MNGLAFYNAMDWRLAILFGVLPESLNQFGTTPSAGSPGAV